MLRFVRILSRAEKPKDDEGEEDIPHEKGEKEKYQIEVTIIATKIEASERSLNQSFQAI